MNYHAELTESELEIEIATATSGEFEGITVYEKDEDGDYTRYYIEAYNEDGDEVTMKVSVEYDGTFTAYVFDADCDDYALLDTWTATTLEF